MSLYSEYRHQNIDQSRNHKRGPLIAVIKIELDEQNTDRIFLHLKDNDEELAEEFIVKHNLNRMLKKHIYQRIKMSRQAVANEQQQQEIKNQERDNEDYEIYGTPIQKRNKKQIDESQKKSDLKRYPLEQMYVDKKNNQTDSRENYYKNSEANKPLIFQRHDMGRKVYDLIQQQQSFSNLQLQNQTDSKIDSNSHSQSYNRYKNLYDVTGIKLKASQPTSNKASFSHLNTHSKQPNDIDSQSSSEQGLFQKQIHTKNNQKLSFEFINQSNESSFRNQSFNAQKNNNQQKRQKQVKNFIQTQQKRQIQQPLNSNNYFDQNPKNTQKIQQRIQNFQQQTKFSSIDKEEVQYTEDNYISFNIPYYEMASQIPNHRSSNNYNLTELTANNENHNSIQNCTKRAGSIRSNVKPLTDSSFRENASSSKTHLYNQKTLRKDQNQVQDLFDESKNFKNLTIKGQQNMQTNSQYIDVNSQYDDQSWRPSRVKFYGKEEIKSLRQSTMSKSLSRTEVSRINKAVTNRLYNEQEIKKKYLNQLKARARNLKEEQNQQEEQLTHKPEINVLSKILAQNRNKHHKPLQDYLIEQEKLIQQKRQDQIDFQAKKQLQNCSFRPRISQHSQKLVSLQKSRSKSRISSNNTDFNRCSSSKKILPQAPTFHPQINKLSQEIAKSKGNFAERQKYFEEEKNSKLFRKQQQQRLTSKIDPKSGKKLFHPQLTQKSIKLAQNYNQEIRENFNKSVHSYLYELSKVPKLQEKFNPKPYINPESQKLIQQLHQKRINWLFLELDNDEDGIISNRKICIDNIPTQMLQIIAPVLYQMEDLETQLSLQDFRNAMKNLTKGLDPWQKSILYGYGTSVRA